MTSCDHKRLCNLCEQEFQGVGGQQYCNDCKAKYSARRLNKMYREKLGLCKPQHGYRSDGLHDWMGENVWKGWHWVFSHSSLPMALCRELYLKCGGTFP